MMTTETTLGELISTMYEEFLGALGDEDLAAIMTANAVNELLGVSEADAERSRAA